MDFDVADGPVVKAIIEAIGMQSILRKLQNP